MINASINKFYILSSLDPQEESTANILNTFLEAEIKNNGLKFDLRHVKFDGIEDLKIITQIINRYALTGEKPFIHIECHGNEKDGLFFKDDTSIKWEKLSELLLEINISCEFNLLIGLAACYGSSFFGNMNPMHPCPCFGVLAPANEVHPGQIISGSREFYATFFRTGSIREANQNLFKAQGAWHMLTADYFYREAIRHFIKTHCTTKNLLSIIENKKTTATKNGSRKSTKQLKNELRKHLEENLVHNFFDQYFSTHKIPDNRTRFISVKNNVQKIIEDLSNTGNYWI